VALRICGEAKVGAGSLTWRLRSTEDEFSELEEFILFNGFQRDVPALFLYGLPPTGRYDPATTTLAGLRLEPAHGDLGPILSGSIPATHRGDGFDLTAINISLHRSSGPGGARRSYLTASCPASPLAAANFTVAQATLESGASQVRGAMRGSCSQLK
jgi:hypothetical protein